jgi:hypothetical protein
MLSQMRRSSSDKTELFSQLQNAVEENQWEKVKEIVKEAENCSLQMSKVCVFALIKLAHEQNLDQYQQFQIALELLNVGRSPTSQSLEEIMANCIMECISSEEHNAVLPFFMLLATQICDTKKLFRKIVDVVIRIGDGKERSKCATIALSILSQLPLYSINPNKQVVLARELLEVGADIFSKASPYNSALYYVFTGQRKELLGLFLDKYPTLSIGIGTIFTVAMGAAIVNILNEGFEAILPHMKGSNGDEDLPTDGKDLMPITPQQSGVDNYYQVSSSQLCDTKPKTDEEQQRQQQNLSGFL